MSTAIPPLVVIALVAAVALCGVGIWAGIEVARAARSSRRLADDLDERVPPLADKLDVTVDAFNAELLRVDIIVNQLEGAVDRLTGTAETVREVVDAPIHLVSEVAERFRHGFRRRGGRRPAHPQPPSDQPQAEVVLLGAGTDLGEDFDASAAASEQFGGGDDGPSVVVPEPETALEPLPEIEPGAAELELAFEPEMESEIEFESGTLATPTGTELEASESPALDEIEPRATDISDGTRPLTDEPEEA